MLVLILLAMAVVAGYVYYEYTTDENGPGSAGENEQVVPPTDPLPTFAPPTIEPSPHDLPVIVPPSDEPEPEPSPAIVQEIEATNVPIESVDQVIEPESSPISD